MSNLMSGPPLGGVQLIDKLIPYANNARTHTDEQVAEIAAAITEFGFTNPILIDGDGGVLAGHGRLLAARKLGMTVVPCIELSHLSETQKRAYILADNRLAEKAGWDLGLVSLELDGLLADGYDIGLTGFDDGFLTAGTEGLTDPDAVPDVPDTPVTVLGDVWILGNHRLMCGDSTSIDAVERLMDGQKADMVFTSPPYNQGGHKQGTLADKNAGKKFYADGISDAMSSDDYISFIKKVLENCFIVSDGSIFWNVSYNTNSKFEYIKQIGDRIDFLVEQICWKKARVLPFKGCLQRIWEPVYIFSTNKQNLNVSKVTQNYWEISNASAQAENHLACFPVDLPVKGISLVEINTGAVLDPFGGSGSTLIACEKTNRNCRMMELDPKYCDVIITRWQDFTGKIATLEGAK